MDIASANVARMRLTRVLGTSVLLEATQSQGGDIAVLSTAEEDIVTVLHMTFKDVGVGKIVFLCKGRDVNRMFRVVAERLAEVVKLSVSERPKEVTLDGLSDPVVIARLEALEASEQEGEE